jgi:hypothetical protein
MRGVIAILILLSLSSPNLSGQEASRWNLGVSPLAGFLMPHHPDMGYLIDGHVVGGEVSIIANTDGSKPWHHWYNFPQWGFTLSAYDLGSEFMGSAFSGRVFFDLPVTKKKTIGLKLAIGAGWITDPFDADENIHNSAIGSHLNASLSVESYVNLMLGKNLLLQPGIAIHHYSNGAMQMPNSGINLAMLRLGIQYRKPRKEIRLNPEFEDKGKNSLFLGISGGMKEIKPIGGEKYAVVNLLAMWTRRISRKSSIGLEGGVNYNESLQYRAQENPDEELDPGMNYRPYLLGIYQLHFDPFSLRFGLGSYVLNEFKEDGAVFFRYHLVYDFPSLQVFAGLKSHYARADNIEFGMAYRLK